jgi:hypothetical protein
LGLGDDGGAEDHGLENHFRAAYCAHVFAANALHMQQISVSAALQSWLTHLYFQLWKS